MYNLQGFSSRRALLQSVCPSLLQSMYRVLAGCASVMSCLSRANPTASWCEIKSKTRWCEYETGVHLWCETKSKSSWCEPQSKSRWCEYEAAGGFQLLSWVPAQWLRWFPTKAGGGQHLHIAKVGTSIGVSLFPQDEWYCYLQQTPFPCSTPHHDQEVGERDGDVHSQAG